MRGFLFVLSLVFGLFFSFNGLAAEKAAHHKEWYTPSTASTFSDGARQPKRGIQVFYDREGGLYPSSNVSIDTNRLIRGFKDPNDAGTVRGYFAREAATNSGVVGALAADAGVSVPAPTWSETNWQRIQAGYRQQLAERINRASKGSSVVFVIHGYRNDYGDAREWYSPLDKMILAQDPDATLVHVYWDGLVGWRFLNLWKKAQYNMADIGLEFRRLLNELPQDMPIRIVTHSTGAPLVANALGDASDAFRQNGTPIRDGDCYFTRAAGQACAPDDGETYVIKPKSHLRFGTIAPAATLDTFNRYSFGRDIYPERISMALNRRDSATGKYFLNCELYGSSCMAVKPVSTCRILTSKFAPHGTDVGVFDFSLSARGTPRTFRFWRQHSVEAYAENERWQAFLQHLLTSADPQTDTGTLCQGEAE